MHSCLATPEIRSLICEEIRLSDSPSRKTSLVALACSCRAFLDPALDSLWFKLDKISPIIRCLPKDALQWAPNSKSDSEKRLTLTRGLAQPDIETSRKYGQRIREITISPTCDVEVTALQLLSMFAGSLFPRLQRFHWGASGEGYVPYLHLFLGKNLIEVDISVGELEVAGATFINALPSSLSPSVLCRLRIRARTKSKLSPITVDYAIWPLLRRLSLPGVTMDDIQQIGKLPNLQRLSLRTVYRAPSEDQRERCVDGLFISLRSLALHGHPASSKTLFPFFQHAKLETLLLSSLNDRPYSDQEWRGFFMSLDRNIDHGSLRTLRIQFRIIPLPTLLPSDILPSLLGFTELRRVGIFLSDSFSPSHDEILQLARSWPHLVELGFNSCTSRPDRRSKLSSLVLWAKHFPKLRHLMLCFDASDNDDRVHLFSRLQTAEFEEFHSSLTCLLVGNSSISHKEFVALFLSKIFPKLEHIRAIHSKRHRWERIEQMLLPLLRASQCSSEKLGEGKWNTGRLKYWWADRNVEDEGDESDSFSKELDDRCNRMDRESDTDD